MHYVYTAVLLSQVVRLLVRLSVRDAGHIGWFTSKVIRRIISLGSSFFGAPTSAISKWNFPTFAWNRDGVAVLTENLQYR